MKKSTVITLSSLPGFDGISRIGVSGTGIPDGTVIEPTRLGPNQLDWLRKNLIYNGIPIFALYESMRSTRVSDQ